MNFEVVNPEGRPLLPVSGAIGTSNAHSMVIAHLFAEYPDVPTKGHLKFKIPSGEIIEHEMPTRPFFHKREIVATLIVTPDIAESLGKFFTEQAAKAKASKMK